MSTLSLYDSCEYEHLDDCAKRGIFNLILNQCEAFSDSNMEHEVCLIIKRRASNGESMEIDDIIKEAVFSVQSHVADNFRAELFRHIAQIL